MKTITFREYLYHMQKSYPKFTDKDNFYNVVLNIYKSVHKEDKQYYTDVCDILSYDVEGRRKYRTKMAEEGKELTPEQVDQLIESMQYALERAEETT